MAVAVETEVNFNTAQCRDWRRRYFATVSDQNKAVLNRAKVLAEIREEFPQDYVDFLRHDQFGFGLISREIDVALELLLAFDRYPDPLLWESLGANMTRLPKIEDAQLRRNVVARCRTIAQYENGHISGSKLTKIIEECDPEYYENHPSEQRLQREELKADLQLIARGVQTALRRLRAEGYTDEEARSFFPRKALEASEKLKD